MSDTESKPKNDVDELWDRYQAARNEALKRGADILVPSKDEVHWNCEPSDGEPMCWEGDCVPGESFPTSTDISKVTCLECRMYYRTLYELNELVKESKRRQTDGH